ncbi:putative efflux pump antibiotic resistance protein [Phaeoacremonium minimum UCRPA7]|uniref:Putative efflux pump antibiotic resistance protein n=1 Tax=Phaeoacremonium minimum (strain UCR-PA7) TaxID=1286976 RepID=R8BS89_PHAM7|nr:putative efflux pump antibiotic resistance protein [Phaeoacremonium minimum UCRPA7]EOO02160.1 putative efflux pump antibiotic resistance protein [Phaeoacremonium minimum UCRPA7]
MNVTMAIVTDVDLRKPASFISNFVTFAGGFKLSQLLGRNVGPGQANWMAASYPLTQSAFVLISGRLGAVYGHQKILLIGGGFLVVFSLINAFCSTYESFVSARALTGIGGGLLMPNAVAMLMIMVPPGRARNVTMAFFAASPPIGGWCGAILAGIFVELTDWKWLFIFIALLGAVVFGGLFFAFPKEQPVDKGGKIDYMGAALGLSSLLLFNFAWNQAPSVGWKTPYEIAIVILSVVLFGLFLVWEKKFAKEPVMPLKIFNAPTFTALVFVVLLTYMSFGISNWYMVAWQQLIRDWTVIQLAIGWIPFALGAVAAVGLAAWLIPRLDAQYILAIGVAVALVSNLLLATMPEQQTYWAQMFPAILLGSVCPDFVFVAAQVIASNSVGRREQGVAGSLIGTLNLYGVSLGLGFAGTIETEIVKDSKDELPGYRAALYFGVALAAAALIMDFAFVRLPKDDREGWSITADDDVPGVGTATGVEGGTAA